MLDKEKRKDSMYMIAFILLIGIVSYAFTHSVGLQDFKNYINSFGKLVPIVLLIIIVVSSSIGFIFAVPVAAAALVLDFYSAFAISVIGLTIGALISFWVSRTLGRDYIERKIIHRIKWLEHYDEHLEKRGFLTVLFLRLITLMPFEIVNIAAGFSRVSTPAYFFGTLLGIIPGILITIFSVRSTNNLESIQFVTSIVIWTAFAILPLLSKRVRKIVFG